MYDKKELENTVQELRNLKAMKEELENELKSVAREIISYMTEKEKNVIVEVNSIQDNRLILKKNSGRCSTVIVNILLDEINNCLVKDYSNGQDTGKSYIIMEIHVENC